MDGVYYTMGHAIAHPVPTAARLSAHSKAATILGPYIWYRRIQKRLILKFSNEPFQREVTLKFLWYRTQEETLGALVFHINPLDAHKVLD